jgi:hypothetical protein
LFGLSSIIVAALHIVSFHALRTYGRRLGLRPQTAFVAVLAYATCFPVLFHGLRVSPEPLLVTFTLVALLQAESCAMALASGRRLRAGVLAGGAGATAMLALFTKLHLAYPLVPIIIVRVLIRHRCDKEALSRARDRLLAASCAAASSLAVFLVCSRKVNWYAFFDFWFLYTPGKPASDPRVELAQRYADNLSVMALGAARAFAMHVNDHFRLTIRGLFTLSDGLFVVVACVGLVLLWSRHSEVRSRLVWPAALCVALLPVIAFRGVWHYYVVHLAVGAIGFAYAIEAWLARRFREAASATRQGLRWPVMATLLVHSASLGFFVATKTHDVTTFRRSVAPYLSALAEIPPGTRAVIVSRRFEFWLLDGGYPNYIDRERVGITQALESSALVVKRADRITPELVDQLNISSVIDASSEIVRQVPIEQWRYVAAPTAP